MDRSAGILLHITSLPGKEGAGTLGEEAFKFVDLLSETGTKLWQILPLGPTGFGNSPYLCYSAFAGNHLLIDLNELIKEGLLELSDLKSTPRFNSGKVDFEKVKAWKSPLLQKAFSNFISGDFQNIKEEYDRFLNEHKWWLEDYALFMALKDQIKGASWNEWNEDLKKRDINALEEYKTSLSEIIQFNCFLQFLFFRQWFALKDYANSKGVRIIGDMPLYVANDSVDVWANPGIFMLDENLEPTHVGGVPPDYFSETGQLWGNPVYNWRHLEERNFDWWIARLHFNLNLFDYARIDHFRGLESFWAVPAGEKTAINGEWLPASGFNLLRMFCSQKENPGLIAEDLGIITPEVERLRDEFWLPGMKVLQFAFSSDAGNKDLPHNYDKNFIAYTGTHDNNTTKGWYKSASREEKMSFMNYFSGKGNAAHRAVEGVWASVANVAIAPLQDILNMDDSARMNIPGTALGNWNWRLKQGDIKSNHLHFLKRLNKTFGRD